MDEQLKSLLSQAIEIVRRESFVEGYHATDEECLGLCVSKYLEWDTRILVACHEALEDANFSGAAEVLWEHIEKSKTHG